MSLISSSLSDKSKKLLIGREERGGRSHDTNGGKREEKAERKSNRKTQQDNKNTH